MSKDIDKHINAVMQSLNWPDDAFMPIANDENRRLMNRMEELITAKDKKSKFLEQLEERVKWFSEHHQNAKADFTLNLV